MMRESLGAHNFLNSRDPVAIKSATNSFDLVLVTANADVDWNAYLNSLKPGGKLHVVGATPPVKADVFALIASERSIGGITYRQSNNNQDDARVLQSP
jgi:alcohol/geraniol dehydrogenase (NADP+)